MPTLDEELIEEALKQNPDKQRFKECLEQLSQQSLAYVVNLLCETVVLSSGEEAPLIFIIARHSSIIEQSLRRLVQKVSTEGEQYWTLVLCCAQRVSSGIAADPRPELFVLEMLLINFNNKQHASCVLDSITEAIRVFGLLIVLSQNEFCTRTYLTWLQELVSKGAVSDEALLTLLSKTTKDGWYLYRTIARCQGQDCAQQYLTWAHMLVEKLVRNRVVSDEKLWALFSQTEKYSWHLGMAIAGYQDRVWTQQYLTSAGELVEKGAVSDKELQAFFSQTNEYGDHLGMVIARYQDSACTQQYFAWVLQLARKGALADKGLWALLSQINELGWHLGMLIAVRQDDACTGQYLACVCELASKGAVSDKELWALLSRATFQGDWDFARIIARCRDSVCTERYLTCLEKLFQKGTLDNKKFWAFLSKASPDGWYFGMTIACHQNDICIQKYLALLQQCIEKKAMTDKQLLKLFLKTNSVGLYFCSYIKTSKSIICWLNLLRPRLAKHAEKIGCLLKTVRNELAAAFNNAEVGEIEGYKDFMTELTKLVKDKSFLPDTDNLLDRIADHINHLKTSGFLPIRIVGVSSSALYRQGDKLYKQLQQEDPADMGPDSEIFSL